MAAGNEFGFKVVIAEAIHLSSLSANKELLVFSSQSDGGHPLIQLDFPDVEAERKGTE